MIAFHCPKCRAGIKVPNERAGHRGRCPKCKTSITVPGDPPNVARPNSAPGRCRTPELQRLYEAVVKAEDVPLRDHAVMEGDKIALQLATGPELRRSHGLSVFVFDEEDWGPCLCIVSRVGSLEDEEDARSILMSANYMVGVRVCLTPDDVILVLAERPLENCRPSDFIVLVKKVARYADRLEKGLFDWDAF